MQWYNILFQYKSFILIYSTQKFRLSDKNKRIKIKEEPVSDIDSTDDRHPVKLEVDIKKELEPEVKNVYSFLFEESL